MLTGIDAAGIARHIGVRRKQGASRTLTVGKAKTDAGMGRVIPLNDRLTLALRTWANKSSARKLNSSCSGQSNMANLGTRRPGRTMSTQ